MAAALPSGSTEVHPVFRYIGDPNDRRAPTNGPLGPKDFLIDEEEFTIGRGVNNSKVLADLRVSRSHCKLEKERGTWYITNMSVNAVTVDGDKLPKNQKTRLCFGAIVQIVANDLVYEFQSGVDVNTADDITEDEIIRIAESFIRDDQNGAGINSSVMVVDEPPQPPPVAMSTLELFNSKKPTVIDLSSPTTSKVETPPNKDDVSAAPKPSTSTDENFADDLSCTICMELFYKAVTLNCSHSFCEFCIKQWKKWNKVCPICRTKLTYEVPSLILNNFVEKVVDTLPLDDRKRREDLIKERQPKTPAKKPTKAKTKRRTPATAAAAARRGTDRRMPTRRGAVPPPNPVAVIDLDNYSDSSLSSTDVDMDMMDYIDEFFDYDGVDYPYYGGYGNCYICHMPGHWANGCPNRR